MTNLTIRFMIRADLHKILEIEALSFDQPWSAADFIRVGRNKNCIGTVALIGPVVVGYVIYEIYRDRIDILNMAVSPFHHRLGIGRALIERQQGKLTREQRSRISLDVRETNLDAQLFFREMGFRAVRVLRNYWGMGEDAYVMVYRIGSESRVIA